MMAGGVEMGAATYVGTGGLKLTLKKRSCRFWNPAFAISLVY